MLKHLATGVLTLLFTTCLLTACESRPTITTSPPPSLHKSPNDDREYLALTLPNQLQVVLVSDPNLEVAAVSLGVGVGSYQDPDSQLGLAHYLEHMLFLGTEKYPEPNSFQKFVDENAGQWNAYTTTDHTNYFFQLNTEKLGEALVYFSDYFVSPTFDPQYSDKERNAVNSEWSMGRSQDGRIISRLEGITANPKHPAQRLTTGNLDTLSDKPGSLLHQELLAFYDHYYSANIMKLTIVSKQSLEELTLLANKHFSAIPNKNITRPKINTPGITAAEKGKVIHYKSLKELKQIIIEFPMTDNTAQWRVKPNAFINNLITSEEPGTLGEQLRSDGLVDGIYGYFAPDNYGKDGYLRVIAGLTDKGLQNRDHVIAAVFSYLDLIKQQGIDESYYHELKAMWQKDFENISNPQPLQQAISITKLQFDYPVENLLNAAFIYDRFDRKAITQVLKQLRPEDARIWLISNKETTDKTIPHYEGSYAIRPITNDELVRWQKMASTMTFSLPPENPLFSQQQAEIVENKFIKPTKILDQQGVEAWLAHAQHYREDKGFIELDININFAASTIENSILATLLDDIFTLKSASLIDRAGRAGIHIGIGLTPESSQAISISGYTQQHSELLKQVIDSFTLVNINEQEFSQALDRFVLQKSNAKKIPPYQQLFGHYGRLIKIANWTDEELLIAAQKLTLTQLHDYHQSLFGKNLIRIYAFGNYHSEQIRDLSLYAKNALCSKNLPEQRYLLPFITPTENMKILYSDTVEQTDSAILDGWIGIKQSLHEQAALIILNGILSNELFTQLRTNEQMGYIVGSAPTNFNEYPMFVMYVQSTNTDLQGIKARLDKFRIDFLQNLQAVTPETLAQLKKSEIANITQKPANFNSEANEHLLDFTWSKLEFDRKERLVSALEKITKEDLINVYQQLLVNQQGARMSIQLKGTHFAELPFAITQ